MLNKPSVEGGRKVWRKVWSQAEYEELFAGEEIFGPLINYAGKPLAEGELS